MTNRVYTQALDTLLLHINEVLSQHPQGITEFNLMTALDRRCVAGFGRAAFADNLSMFQSHFFVVSWLVCTA